jgi:hypothetical protein
LLRIPPLFFFSELFFPCSVQPSEAVRKVVFGGQVTEEEAESLNKR